MLSVHYRNSRLIPAQALPHEELSELEQPGVIPVLANDLQPGVEGLELDLRTNRTPWARGGEGYADGREAGQARGDGEDVVGEVLQLRHVLDLGQPRRRRRRRGAEEELDLLGARLVAQGDGRVHIGQVVLPGFVAQGAG